MSQESVKSNEALASPKTAAEIKKGLSDNYGSLELNRGEGIVLAPEVQPLSRCGNQKECVYQNLMAVIKAGDEFFSVVDVFSADPVAADQKLSRVKTTVITHHVSGSRAEIVGFINEGKGPLEVGRTVENEYADNMSRSHFAVGLSPENGRIGIADDSTNGTEVFISLAEINEPLKDSNPAKDIDFWSIKSSQLRASIESQIESQ